MIDLDACQNLVFGVSRVRVLWRRFWRAQNAFRSRHPSKIDDFDVLLNVEGAISLETSFKNRAGPLQNSNERPIFARDPSKTRRMSTVLKEWPSMCAAVVILETAHFEEVLFRSFSSSEMSKLKFQVNFKFQNENVHISSCTFQIINYLFHILVFKFVSCSKLEMWSLKCSRKSKVNFKCEVSKCNFKLQMWSFESQFENSNCHEWSCTCFCICANIFVRFLFCHCRMSRLSFFFSKLFACLAGC